MWQERGLVERRPLDMLPSRYDCHMSRVNFELRSKEGRILSWITLADSVAVQLLFK